MRGFGPPIKYCPYGSKVMYDKRGAITAKNHRWAESHIELRIYQCPNCNAWHLTKMMHYKNNQEN